MALLRDARTFTGRDPETGEIIQKSTARQGSWLGNVGYLILLDQIGEILKPRGGKRISENISTALKYFAPDLSETDRKDIHVLRCSFAHNFSFCNFEKKRHFKVTNGPGQVVVPAAEPWNGDIAAISEKNATTINLEALGNLDVRRSHSLA